MHSSSAVLVPNPKNHSQCPPTLSDPDDWNDFPLNHWIFAVRLLLFRRRVRRLQISNSAPKLVFGRNFRR